MLEMTKEEILLGVEMGRLEIEPANLNKARTDENPFDSTPHQKRGIFNRIFIQNKCSCSSQKHRQFGITKKRHNSILKEPVLKILKCKNSDSSEKDKSTASSQPHNLHVDTINLCTLVQTCNQLKISTEDKESGPAVRSSDLKWWKSDSSSVRNGESRVSQTGTCSQQALNPPCDVTIDELASYFETLVHIPKKMSSMAEMMYI